MGKYRKIPIVIDAVQWFPLPEQPVEGVITPITSAQAKSFGLSVAERHGHGIVKTLEGPHLVRPGDWIITGVEGEKYPCKDSVFQKSYEAVPSNQIQKQAEDEDETTREVRHLERTSVPYGSVIDGDHPPIAADFLLPEEKEDYCGGGGTFGGGGSSTTWESDDRSTSDTPSDSSGDSASDSCSSDSSSSSDSCSSDSGSSSSD